MDDLSSPSAPLGSGPSFLDRGRALTLVAEGLILLAWALAGLAALDVVEFGLLGALLGAAGIIVSAVAFFLLARLGRFALAAGWTQAGGIALAVIVFLAIPGAREWGKLGAFIVACITLAVTNAAAHLVAGVGLMRGGYPKSGATTMLAMSLAAFSALMIPLVQGAAAYPAIAFTLVGHIALIVGVAAPRARALPSAS